jgi:hypothetical protein
MGEAAKQYRITPSYQKPAGGFLAIGPRYPGELVDGGQAVRFVHPGLATWVETVPIEHVEDVTGESPRYRRRWK